MGEHNLTAKYAVPQIRRVLHWAQRAGRILTSDSRRLPDFLIIGAQRCGTTSLYEYLTDHPSIAPAWRKEVHFFDKHYSKGMRWYRSNFSKEQVRENPACPTITGEATPFYLMHPTAAERVSKHLPNVKCIALLRDPVDRAISHYHHVHTRGFEKLSLETALDLEHTRISGEMDRILDGGGWSFNLTHYSYVRRGIYVDQLQKWYQSLERERVLVIQSERLFADPHSILSEILAFLGLPPMPANIDFPALNAYSYDLPDQEIIYRLTEYFHPHNERLFELLGREFNWRRPNRPSSKPDTERDDG